VRKDGNSKVNRDAIEGERCEPLTKVEGCSAGGRRAEIVDKRECVRL
jgi:hypothetical protein